MIGTFWNLCRACPSMPVDKLHSEYQSTYRWYEYKGPIQEVVNKPPQPVPNGSAPPIKEKTVRIDIKEPRISNDVVDAAAPASKRIEPALPRRRKNPELAYRAHKFMSTMNEERDKVPNDIPVSAATERARRLEHTNGPTSAAFRNAVSKISTEYRLQFAWPREGEERLTNGKPLASSTIPEAGLGPPRKSISMGTIKQNQSNIAPVHRKRNTEADKKDGQSEAEPLVTDNRNEDLRGYKTEYKKKFRPFSHYDYVGGRFLQKEASNEHKNEVAVPPDSMWYKEVLELRKKADEYKHRGWGADMLAEGESDTRLELWQQVLCRSSLSALSLASTTPRPGAKDEKTAKKVWPGRAAWSRNTTPHQRDKSVSQHKDERSQSRVRSAKLNIRSTGGRSKSVDPGISETKSPKRTPRSPVPQAGTKTAKTSSEARPRPTTLTTTAPSRPKTSPSIKKSKDDIKLKNSASTTAKSVGQSVAKKGDTSKKDTGLEQKEDEEPTSLIDEPIVKSPPEPTRVKSPEQMMIRSPEPVNWTVPLDTGKTFTVTQNVQGEALARLQGESIPASTTPQVHSQVSSGLVSTDNDNWKSSPLHSVTSNKKSVNGFDSISSKTEDTKVPQPTEPHSKCVDDPSFTFDSNQGVELNKLGETNITCDPLSTDSLSGGVTSKNDAVSNNEISVGRGQQPLGRDILDSARNRFEQFWVKSSPEVDQEK